MQHGSSYGRTMTDLIGDREGFNGGGWQLDSIEVRACIHVRSGKGHKGLAAEKEEGTGSEL